MNTLYFMEENIRVAIPEKVKAEIDVSAFMCSATNKDSMIDPNLAEPLVLHQEETAKMSSGYIRIPRSLTDNPLWINLPPKYKMVFIKILELALYKPQLFDDHGNIIQIQIGQICITERELLEECGKYFSLNDIHRSILKFKKYKFVNQEVKHFKNILTIAHPETYDLIKQASEPRSESGLNQDRIRIESEKKKERKKEGNNNKKAPSSLSVEATALLIFFNSSLKENIPEVVEPCEMKQASYFQLLLKDYSHEEIQKSIKFSHTSWWAKVVHTPFSLKKNFTKILAAMRREHIPTQNNQVDRRTKDINGAAVASPHDGRF